MLANACDVKGKKDHKTDVIDAEHLATLGRLDAVKGSFVPIRAVRDMRLISRAYIRARQDLSRAKNRKTKYLNAIGTRAGSVFSDINGKAAREILTAWVEDNPRLGGDHPREGEAAQALCRRDCRCVASAAART